jgi:hypothetical protein
MDAMFRLSISELLHPREPLLDTQLIHSCNPDPNYCHLKRGIEANQSGKPAIIDVIVT